MRRLIINADDFGMTSGINRAILEAHRAGIVTSSTIMANERAVDDAIALASQNPSLGTGCHIVLADGVPVSAADRVPSLIGSQNGNGARFRPGIAKLAAAVLAGKVREEEVRIEAGAQIEKLQARGVKLSHLDSHMHSHVLPPVARGVLQAAREHGITAVRNPIEPAWSLAATHKASSLRSWNRSAQVTILRTLRSQFLDVVRKNGLKIPDGNIGIAVTGLMNRELLTRLVESMPEGTWELVAHPGYNDRELSQVRTSLRKSRAVELELLTSPETVDLFRKREIQLISFRDL